MKYEVDGVEYDIPESVIAGGDEEIELVPQNRFIFGLNVNHTGELAKMGDDIANFLERLGGGEVEIQVSVNAGLNEIKDKVMGFHTEELEPAVGFAIPTEDDYEEYEDYPEEDKLNGKIREVKRG